MKKVLLMSMDTAVIEWSPAKYQLLNELKLRGFEIFVFSPKRQNKGNRIASIDHAVDTQNMTKREICKKIMQINPQIVIATLYIDTAIIYTLPFIMKNTSFYYYNLEIYTPYLNKDVKKENYRRYINYKMKYPIDKLKEIIYTRSVKGFTIQDSIRRQLSRKYHVWHSNTILIPNSYVYDEAVVVPEGQDGILYTGGIKRDFLLEQFDDLKNVKDVPLVFSGTIDQWCLQRIKELKITNPNIKFVQQILPIEEYTEYMRHFAIGLVWYSPLREDEAHYYMGLSSGKMFKHLSLGQPIIAVACPGITETVKRYKLGVVINHISELADAYDVIMQNYSYYRENVIKAYKNKFDFKKRILPFLECIEENMKA